MRISLPFAIKKIAQTLGMRRLVTQAKKIAPAAIVAGGLAFLGSTADLPAIELIENGGFELNDGFNGDNVGFSWQNDDGPPVFDVYSHTTQVYYDGPAPAGAGEWYFHTVGVNNPNGIYQEVDLTTAATPTQIDAGTAAFNLGAWLAGYTPQDDHPDVALQFFDGAGAAIGGPLVIDGSEFGPGSFFVETADGTDINTYPNPIAAWKRYEAIQGVAIGARSARVTILQSSLTGNGNDNYVDLVSLDVDDTGVEQFLKIQVNTNSGGVTMTNGTVDPVSINYYEIVSPSGSLSPTGWNSFDDQNLDPAGPLPEQNWTEGGGSDANKLVEACLLCQTEFAQGGSHTLGQAFNTSVGGQDLEFYYAGPSGQLFRGIVEYVAPMVNCDFDNNQSCDVNDIDMLVAEIVSGTNGANFDLNGDGVVTREDITDPTTGWLAVAGNENLGPGRAYLEGDANLDSTVDGQDFIAWNNNKFTSIAAWSAGDFNADGAVDGQDFILWNNNKFTAADGVASVPEPTSLLPLLVGIGAIALRRRENVA